MAYVIIMAYAAAVRTCSGQGFSDPYVCTIVAYTVNSCAITARTLSGQDFFDPWAYTVVACTVDFCAVSARALVVRGFSTHGPTQSWPM